MEHFRRLGFADEIRAQGLPADHPTDIAYFTRYTGHELARLRLPTAAQAVRNSQGHERLVERGRTAAPRVAEVRRGRPCARQAAGPAGRRRALRLALREFRRHAATSGGARCAPAAGGAAVQVQARATWSAPTARAAWCAARWASPGAAPAACSATSWAARCSRSTCARRTFTSVFPHARAWMYVSVNRAAARLHGLGGRRGRSSPSTPPCTRRRRRRGLDRRRRAAHRSLRPSGTASADRDPVRRHLDRRAIRWWRSVSSAAACSSPATPRTCSRRPAAWATTPRSRTR